MTQEQIEKRRAYQREYYKEHRRGERALAYACNIAAGKKKREARQAALNARRASKGASNE